MVLRVWLLAVVWLFFLFGCQSASNLLHSKILHRSYNAQLSSCDLKAAKKRIVKSEVLFLRDVQLGQIAFYQKDFRNAEIYFNKAVDFYQHREKRPVLALSDYLVFDYNGEGYDKVFLHNYNALNYLLIGDLENAMVESRNSDFIQRQERVKFYKEISSYHPSKQLDQSLLNRYEVLFSHVNPAHNPYQNPFSFYLSALLYEEKGAYDEAMIDMQNALKWYPDSSIMKEKLAIYKSHKKNRKRVEIFFDIGRSPVKTQENISVKVTADASKILYLPSFELYLSDISKIIVTDSIGNVVATSSILSDIKAIKINAFKKKLPSLLDKLISEIAKEAISYEVTKHYGTAGSFYKMLNVIYSQNNNFSWILLPERIEVISFVPKKKENYILKVIDKNGKILDRLSFCPNFTKNLKNFYHCYVVKDGKFCRVEEE